jgi:hypothetical protein
MDILKLAQEASKRLSEPTIVDLFNDSNAQSIKYLASANKMARDIAERYEWSNLIIDGSFDTEVDEQLYDLPSDFKDMVTYFLWNSTRQWAIQKETPDRAVGYPATGSTSWTDTGFRIVRDQFRFTVPADSIDTIVYNYKSNGFAKCSETVDEVEVVSYEDNFSNNNCEFLLDDEALIRGIVFDISRIYGFSNAAILKQEYEDMISELKAKDAGKQYIAVSSERRRYPFPRQWNLVGEDY